MQSKQLFHQTLCFMNSSQQMEKPTLLVALEQLGFSWAIHGENQTISLNDRYGGFWELEKFFKLAAQLPNSILAVSAKLDYDFWHPTILFLDQYPYGYSKFCLENFGNEIPHVESPPNQQAFAFTIDMMIKNYGEQQVPTLYWKRGLQLPSCTKSRVMV